MLLAACGSAAADGNNTAGAETQPTPTATATPTPTPTPTPTASPTPSPTATPTLEPTPTIEFVPSTPPPSCPVTKPGSSTFVPPEPYPVAPPPLYDAVWYGSEALWTMVSPEGEIWQGLPYHADFSDEPVFVQKSFWWRSGYSASDEPRPQLTVTGKRLDKPGPTFEAGGPGTNGYRADIGSFMLTGIGIPTPGCWEITGRYGDAELSYVVWVATPA